jgi:ATP adenylyltransferase
VVPYEHVPGLEDLSHEALAEVGDLVIFSLLLLRETMNPEGFNIGVNQGKIAGAGVADHVHVHVVPRWGGDTNFMTVVAGTRVIPEWIDRTYERLMETLEKHPELRP